MLLRPRSGAGAESMVVGIDTGETFHVGGLTFHRSKMDVSTGTQRSEVTTGTDLWVRAEIERGLFDVEDDPEYRAGNDLVALVVAGIMRELGSAPQFAPWRPTVITRTPGVDGELARLDVRIERSGATIRPYIRGSA